MKIKVLRNPARKHGLDPEKFFEGAVENVDDETADKLIKLRIAEPFDDKKKGSVRGVSSRPAVANATDNTTKPQQ